MNTFFVYKVKKKKLHFTPLYVVRDASVQQKANSKCLTDQSESVLHFW